MRTAVIAAHAFQCSGRAGPRTHASVVLQLVDPSNERLLQRCNGLARSAQPPSSDQADATMATMSLDKPEQAAAGLTQAEVFSLSSRPGAKKKLVLDFDGHTTTGTDWNHKGLETIVSPPWDTDKNPNSFSANELAQIKAIWSKVAEDYAAFDVDVTTIDPGDQALLGVGTRAIIGGDSSVLPDFQGSGGMCYVGSFGTKTPCFIFPYELYSQVKTVADAVTHELGHALGLLHDGTSQYEYFGGQGNWAPIMVRLINPAHHCLARPDELDGERGLHVGPVTIPG